MVFYLREWWWILNQQGCDIVIQYKDMTVQQMSLNGTVINATYANADQVSGNFDIGLYFLKVGTVEIDNLLVYSYGDGGYLQQD